MTRRTALITGITGQVGSYLAETLLERDYIVHGIVRREAAFDNISSIRHRLTLHYGDLLDEGRLLRIIADVRPHELYNLAAQTHVQISFEQPVYTGDVTALGPLRLFESLRTLGLETRVYQASSSEMFGTSAAPQGLDTPFTPVSPYAVAKLYAHQLAGLYRDSYGMYIARGIMFNAESPRRSPHFVTRKIVLGALECAFGWRDHIALGNTLTRRDWGYAGDYAEAIWETLQKPTPGDYVIATGVSHSIPDFAKLVFAIVNERCQGKHRVINVDEHIKPFVPEFTRPIDVPDLRGTPSFDTLSWRPRTSLEHLVALMVSSDHVAMLSRGPDF